MSELAQVPTKKGREPSTTTFRPEQPLLDAIHRYIASLSPSTRPVLTKFVETAVREFLTRKGFRPSDEPPLSGESKISTHQE